MILYGINILFGGRMAKKEKPIIQIWEKPGLRKDKHHNFNLRIPEPDFLKLKVLSEDAGQSMHKWVLKALIKSLNDGFKNYDIDEEIELVRAGKAIYKDMVKKGQITPIRKEK